MRQSCLLAVPDAHPTIAGPRGRRRGTGPALVSAFALHAACLGALTEFQNIETPPAPQRETVIELATLVRPKPVSEMLPDPSTSEAPAPQLSADEPMVSPPPEPIEVAATPPETAPPVPLAQLPVAGDPAPAAMPPFTQPVSPLPDVSSPVPEMPEPETTAAVTSAPAVEIAPPQPRPKPLIPLPLSVHAPPHPVALAPLAIATRLDGGARSAAAKTETSTPTAAALASAPAVANQEAALEARIRDAVQAAVRYPAAARMMGVTGRARLLLDYRSGSVSNPTLAQSSGASMLDEAALAAARAARYPVAPPAIEGRLLRLLIWVEFKSG